MIIRNKGHSCCTFTSSYPKSIIEIDKCKGRIFKDAR